MDMLTPPEAAGRPGHYSLGVRCNGFTFLSGQLPIDWHGTGKLAEGGVQAQARQALTNLAEALHAAGLTVADVVKTTVLIAGIELWPAVDQVYSEFFGPHRPARTIVPTLPLHYGALIEIEAIACEKERM